LVVFCINKTCGERHRSHHETQTGKEKSYLIAPLRRCCNTSRKNDKRNGSHLKYDPFFIDDLMSQEILSER
jgi:hypothetical protein